MTRLRDWSGLLLLLWLFCTSPAAAGEEYFARYALPRNAASVDIGVQPLGFPAAMIGALVQRDRILKRRLEELGQPLATFAFRRGSDMLDLLADDRLEAGLLGDLPTILLAARTDVAIAGLTKRSATALVARQEGLLANLQGKRLAYVPDSSAHYTLLQALASVGLSEQDVTLVPLAIDEMPAALAQGRIDGFAAWEPAPTIALASLPQARIVFRGPSSDYLVLTRRFVKRHPEAARHLVAALIRALEWMRQNRKNIESAVRWAMHDGSAFSGQAPALTLAQAVTIARREIIEVPAAPAIPAAIGDRQPLLGEFHFLQRLGKLPANTSWERLAMAFAYDGLQQVSAAPARYRPYVFDYEP